MLDYYCEICDKTINRKSKTKHINSKTHLNTYFNIVINKHIFGDVFWIDFEETIHEYIVNHSYKFQSFTTTVECKLDDEDINYSVNEKVTYDNLYKYIHSGWCFDRFCKSKEIREYVYYSSIIIGVNLYCSTVINDVIITFHSNYKTMTTKHRFQQPRKILESKMIKHIKNLSNVDKEAKNNRLACEFGLNNF